MNGTVWSALLLTTLAGSATVIGAAAEFDIGTVNKRVDGRHCQIRHISELVAVIGFAVIVQIDVNLACDL